jgi:hypothetical protein
LEKLSTVEGLKNRHEIIESLSVDELKTNMSLKEIKDMSKQEVIKMDEIIKSTLSLDPEKLTKKLSTEFPNYNFDANSYRDLFMKATEEEINSGKTVAERDRFKKEILDADLLEIQSTGGTSNITDIKNVIRENYTHNSLLNEIKNVKKPNYESMDDLKILEVEKEIYSNPSRLNKILDKAVNLQSLEDFNLENKTLFEYECSKVKPDELINTLKNRSDYAEDSYIDSVITKNIDENIKNMIEKYNGKESKQYIIEKLLLENPNHKDKILSIVGKTFDEQLEYWENKFSARDFARLKKGLAKEDLKELQNLGENKTIDQIKTVATVNKSHINFLKEIKTKASQTSLNKSSFDTTHLDDTMNLFD